MQHITGFVIFALIVTVSTLSSGLSVSAQQDTTKLDSVRSSVEEKKVTMQEKREAVKTKLSDEKLKVCQNREKSIKNIMSRLANRGEKQLELFTKIAERTKAFYVTKQYSIENYEALVAAVDTNKATAQAAVEATRQASTSFNCSAEAPKQTVSDFKVIIQQQHEALKKYKTAVKDLIVGVKSAKSVTTDSGTAETEGQQ